jgi:hypothetical protein
VGVYFNVSSSCYFTSVLAPRVIVGLLQEKLNSILYFLSVKTTYRPHTKATIVILLIHIIDKYKENLAGIKNICSML